MARYRQARSRGHHPDHALVVACEHLTGTVTAADPDDQVARTMVALVGLWRQDHAHH